MSPNKQRVEELASALGEDQLEQVIDFMRFLLRKQERSLQQDLAQTSESSLAFWNTEEDEVWDHV